MSKAPSTLWWRLLWRDTQLSSVKQRWHADRILNRFFYHKFQVVLDIFFLCDFLFYCQISHETRENILRTAFTYLCFLFQNMWKGRALIIFIVTFSILYNFVKFFELTVQTKVSQSCTIFYRFCICVTYFLLQTYLTPPGGDMVSAASSSENPNTSQIVTKVCEAKSINRLFLRFIKYAHCRPAAGSKSTFKYLWTALLLQRR